MKSSVRRFGPLGDTGSVEEAEGTGCEGLLSMGVVPKTHGCDEGDPVAAVSQIPGDRREGFLLNELGLHHQWHRCVDSQMLPLSSS